MNETFVKARSIFDQMMEESLARHSQGNSHPPARWLAKRSRSNKRSQHTISLSTDTNDQVPSSVFPKRSAGASLVTNNLGTALIPSHHNPDTRLNCTMGNPSTSTLSSNPPAHTNSQGLTRTVYSTNNLSSIRVMQARQHPVPNYHRSSRCRLAIRVDLQPPNPVSISSRNSNRYRRNHSSNRYRLSHNHNPRFSHHHNNRSSNSHRSSNSRSSPSRFNLNRFSRRPNPNRKSNLNPWYRPNHRFSRNLKHNLSLRSRLNLRFKLSPRSRFNLNPSLANRNYNVDRRWRLSLNRSKLSNLSQSRKNLSPNPSNNNRKPRPNHNRKHR